MTQFAGQEKVGGAKASEAAKCMQYPLTQNKLYNNERIWEGRIYLFDLHTSSVDYIAKFTNHLCPYEIITKKDKVDFFI